MGDDENTTMNWTTSDLTSTTMTSSLNTTGSTTTTLAEEISIKVFGDGIWFILSIVISLAI